MNKLYNKLFIFLPALSCLMALSGCDRGQYEFESWEWEMDSTKSAFQAYSTRVTDLSKGIPADCLIPVDETTKTTSTTVNVLVSDIFEVLNKGKVLEISGKYESFSLKDFSRGWLSGKVLLPKDRRPSRYIIVNHYTIGANYEAPSNIFPIEGVLCDMGYALICPDYRGYGIDAHNIHPYLIMDQTAFDVCMMYFAVKSTLEGTPYQPVHDDIYIMGFSQGGAVTMAVEYYLETIFGLRNRIRQVFAGGGPYDVRETYSNFINTNVVNIAPAVPLVVQGMIYGNDLDIDMGEILEPWVCEKMDEWINSKNYSVDQLRTLMGTTTTSDLLTDKGMDQTSDEVSELYKAMTENSILAYNWSPQAPVYLFHSMEDNVVPFVNAAKAKNKWKDANIQYNFGYYGTHQSATLRFIYTVKTWLKNEGE